MPLADGHQACLHRRKPKREGSGIVLDEDAEEALDRAEEGAVDHHGLMTLAVFAHVLKLEAGGQVEVELHGGKLPEAAENIDEFYVDFWAVEGSFAGDGLVGDPLAVKGALQRPNRQVPVFVGP